MSAFGHTSRAEHARPFVAALAAGGIALDVAWLVAHGHASLATSALAIVVASVATLRRPSNGLVLGAALVVLVPFRFTIGVHQASVPRVAALLALAGLFVMATTAYRVERIALTLADAAALGYVTAIFISWTVTPHVPSSLQAAVNAVLPLSFYLAARCFANEIRWRLAWVLVVGGALASLTVLYEYFVTHRPLFVNPDDYLWNAKSDLIFRPGGVFGSPPAAATVLAMTSLCGLALVTRARGRERVLALACTGVSIGALITTFTRAGMIGLCLGAVVYLAIQRPPSLGRITLVLAAVTLVLTFIVLPRIESASWYQQGVLRGGNLALREAYWREAWPLITNSSQHLVFGHGINSLLIGRPDLPGDADPDLSTTPTLLQIGPHNQYVRTMFEGGLVGLALLLGWLLSAMKAGIAQALRMPGSGDRPLYASFAGALTAFLVVSSAGDSLRHPASFATAALIAGLLASNRGTKRGKR